MYKITGIVFLVVANLVLLVHAIVPHHHHNHSACFVKVISHQSDFSCNHSNKQGHNSEETNACNSNDKDGEHEKGGCLLKDILAITPVSHKHEYTCALCVNDNLDSYQILQVLNSDETEGHVKLYGLPFRQNQLIPTYQINYVSHCLGLRAPPFV